MAQAAVTNGKKSGGKELDGAIHPLTYKTLTAVQKKTLDELGKEKLAGMYRRMFLIRSFEQRAEQMYQQRKVGGFLHLYLGQEAVGVGMLSALQPEDYVATSYRDHGIALSLGCSPNQLMAELFGKSAGISRGKGGSMHYYSKEKNLLGGHGIVGGQIPVGLGAAFSAKYRGTDQISMTFLGDGAVHQGTFHECCNMASLWKLPIIYVIENNQYGMGTSVDRSSAVQDMTLKAAGYNMEGVAVDGMNLLDCYATVRDAVAKRRKQPAPLLIEAKTYRFRGHSISDPATYRSKDEIQRYQAVDPVMEVKNLLSELGWMTEVEVKDLEKDVRREVADAVKFADDAPEPDLAERDLHVFAE